MSELLKKLGLIASLVIAGFALAGCEDNNLEDAADDMGDSVENASDEVGDAAEDAADNIKDATN